MGKNESDIFNADKKEAERLEALGVMEAEAKQRRINFGLVFSTREGFEVVKDIMNFCHANEISYTPSNQYETAFREGERNVFLFILSNLSGEMRQRLIIGG